MPDRPGILLSAALALFAMVGCIQVTIPPDASGGGATGATGGPPIVTPPGDNSVVDDPDAGGPGLVAIDAAGDPDEAAGDPVISCANHCQCPGGQDCINERCQQGEMNIWCCTEPECPEGAQCWFADDSAGLCVGR